MAASAIHHTRSVSLPSRSPPIVAQFDEDLSRLRSSEAASTSYSTVSHRLGSLQTLYIHLNELLSLPVNQQTLSHNHQAKWIDVVLDGSLRLLDLCGTAKDALSQTKECLQDIQSVLRRRFGGEMSISSEVVEYMNTRKKVKKAIKNSLRDMKTSDKDDGSNALFSMLRDVEAVTSDILKSLLSYIAGPKTQARKSNWSLVAKFVHQNGNKEEAASTSEFEAIDDTLNSLMSHKKKNGFNMTQVGSLRSQIVELDCEIQDLDEVLESLCRHLVKTRATLLNALSN